MNKRLAITAQKAVGKGKLLWLDCYSDAIYDTVSPTLKTTTKSSEMNFIMEQGEINETQKPQQDYPKMKTDKMLNVITLFSGYDSQALALNRLGIPYNLAAWCEIDRHAITAHNALFPQWKDRNLGDVSRVDWAEWHTRHPQPIDLLTYSSPCQDFSSAGLQRGGEEGSGTRSGLLWETERAVRELRPRHLVFENVGGLVSDKFIDLFNRWQARLNGYGYTNFQQLMNAKDYGVPQNRLRIFMVSILDCPRAYYFPKPFKLQRRLKDVLEQNVEERYYLKDDAVKKLTANIDELEAGQHLLNGDSEGNASTITTGHDRALNITQSKGGHKQMGVFEIAEPQMLGWTRNEKGEITDRHPVNIANCVTAAKRDNTQNYIMEPTIAAMRGRDKDNPNDQDKSTNNYTQRLELKPDGTSNTLTSVAKDNLLIEPLIISPGHGYFEGAVNAETSPTVKCSAMQAQHYLIEPTIIDTTNDFSEEKKRTYTDYSPALRSSRSGLMTTEGIRIRRLTERELYRLMDVEEKDIDTLLSAPIPRTQHAKLAGNSIVVACLYYIFRNLFVNTEPEVGTQTKLF